MYIILICFHYICTALIYFRIIISDWCNKSTLVLLYVLNNSLQLHLRYIRFLYKFYSHDDTRNEAPPQRHSNNQRILRENWCQMPCRFRSAFPWTFGRFEMHSMWQEDSVGSNKSHNSTASDGGLLLYVFICDTVAACCSHHFTSRSYWFEVIFLGDKAVAHHPVTP